MSAQAPWSVKGIDKETRDRFKQLAKNSGVTLGELMRSLADRSKEMSGAAPGHAEKTEKKTEVTVKKSTAKKTIVKKAVAKKPAVKKKVVAEKPATKKTVVKKTATKKPVAKKTETAKKTATVKKAVVKKAAVKKVVATKKPALKKAVVKKTAVKKAVVKKAAVKKSVKAVKSVKATKAAPKKRAVRKTAKVIKMSVAAMRGDTPKATRISARRLMNVKFSDSALNPADLHAIRESIELKARETVLTVENSLDAQLRSLRNFINNLAERQMREAASAERNANFADASLVKEEAELTRSFLKTVLDANRAGIEATSVKMFDELDARIRDEGDLHRSALGGIRTEMNVLTKLRESSDILLTRVAALENLHRAMDSEVAHISASGEDTAGKLSELKELLGKLLSDLPKRVDRVFKESGNGLQDAAAALSHITQRLGVVEELTETLNRQAGMYVAEKASFRRDENIFPDFPEIDDETENDKRAFQPGLARFSGAAVNQDFDDEDEGDEGYGLDAVYDEEEEERPITPVKSSAPDFLRKPLQHKEEPQIIAPLAPLAYVEPEDEEEEEISAEAPPVYEKRTAHLVDEIPDEYGAIDDHRDFDLEALSKNDFDAEDFDEPQPVPKQTATLQPLAQRFANPASTQAHQAEPVAEEDDGEFYTLLPEEAVGDTEFEMMMREQRGVERKDHFSQRTEALRRAQSVTETPPATYAKDEDPDEIYEREAKNLYKTERQTAQAQPRKEPGAPKREGYYEDLASYTEISEAPEAGESPVAYLRKKNETARAALHDLRQSVRETSPEKLADRFTEEHQDSEDYQHDDGDYYGGEYDETDPEQGYAEVEPKGAYDPYAQDDPKAGEKSEDFPPDIREIDKVNMMRRAQKASIAENLKESSVGFLSKLKGVFTPKTAGKK